MPRVCSRPAHARVGMLVAVAVAVATLVVTTAADGRPGAPQGSYRAPQGDQRATGHRGKRDQNLQGAKGRRMATTTTTTTTGPLSLTCIPLMEFYVSTVGSQHLRKVGRSSTLQCSINLSPTSPPRSPDTTRRDYLDGLDVRARCACDGTTCVWIKSSPLTTVHACPRVCNVVLRGTCIRVHTHTPTSLCRSLGYSRMNNPCPRQSARTRQPCLSHSFSDVTWQLRLKADRRNARWSFRAAKWVCVGVCVHARVVVPARVAL